MLFNSIVFLVFYVAVFALYYLIPVRFRWALLLLASYFFYMYWEPGYILLILLSTVIDYFVAGKMSRSPNPVLKKRLLLISLCSNLGLLFVFKYFNFFNENIGQAAALLNLPYTPAPLDILLPVGISFYTFQTLSYTIDVYRGILQPERHPGKFALYVSFFPQLVAGPIERATRLLPQLARNDNKLEATRFLSGFTQAMFGFFKKVVVADTLAIYVDSIYNNYQVNTGFTLVFATWMFAFQIYCDFSGYSDIAIGTARMLGYDLMDNFRIPYFSKSVTEFWRRWHISLSTWLRDYLYIPLGGNRFGNLATYKNLLITMLLGGLWHGASWNFVIWGALNGLYLSAEKFLKIPSLNLNRSIPVRVVTAFITFNLICLTWVFFRAQTIEQSLEIVKSIVAGGHFFNFNLNNIPVMATMLAGVFILLLAEFVYLRKKTFTQLVKEKRLGWVIAFNLFFLLLILAFGITSGSQFIYFQF